MANEFKIKKGLIVTGATGGTALDVQGSQGQLFSVTDNLSGSIFAVSDISGVPILDVNSSGLSTFAGTISSGAITSTSNIESQDTFILNYNNAGNKWQQLFDGSNGWNLRYYNATTEAWSSNYINVSTLGNTTFAGNVGIGHTVLYQKFTVNGNIDIRGGDGSFLTFNNGDANISIHNNDVGSVSGRDLSFKTWKSGVGNTEKMRIDRDGNVGIGTASPNPFSWGTRHLTVQSAGTNTYAAIDIIGSGSGAGALLFGGGSGSGTATNIGRAQISALDGSHLAFYTNGSNSGASFNERMRITNGGNVGIGTITPDSKLDVTGGDITVNTSGVGFMNFKYGSVGSESTMGSIQTTGIDLKINATSDLLLLPGSNVGIGTTSPNAKLDVQSSTTGNLLARVYNPNTGTSSSATFRIASSANNANSASLQFSDSTAYTATISGDRVQGLVFRTSASGSNPITIPERMRITPTGNVGIGTTSPNGKLSFENSVETRKIVLYEAYNNDFQFYGFGIEANTLVYTTAFNDDDHVFYSGVSATTRNELMRIEGGGNVGIGTSTPNAKLDIQGTQGQLFSVTDDLSGDIFSVADISGVPIMNVNSDGTSYFDGNVGIGTTSPAHPLTVVQKIASIGGTNNAKTISINVNDSWGYLTTTAANFYINKGIRVDTGEIGSYNEDLQLKTGGNTRVAILNSNGNVGIGTTSPSKLLTLNAASGGALQWQYNDGNYLRIEADSGGGSYYAAAGLYHRFFTSGSERMRIDSSGNVGIGTTNPNTKLVVTQSANNSSPAIIVNNASNGANGYTFQSWRYIEASTGYRLDLKQRVSSGVVKYAFDMVNNGTGYNSTLVLDRGNVGIGTDSPDEKLSVDGNIFLQGNDDYIAFNTSASSGHPKIKMNSDADFSFLNTAGSNIFHIENGGNVGIGTTSPSDTLEVEGGVTITSETPTKLLLNNTKNGSWTQGEALGLVEFYGNDASGGGAKVQSSIEVVSQDQYGAHFNMTFNLSKGSSGNAELMRLTGEGRLGIGTAGPLATLHVDNNQTSNGTIGIMSDAAAGGTGTRNIHINLPEYGEGIRFLRSGTYSGGAMKFYSGSSNVGSVQINASSTSFNTTSDYRAKENVVPMENSINRLKELKPCRFNFLIDPENTVDGFIAHEAQEVVPEAITGEKDKLDYEGNPEYQGIDQSKLVPLLTSALQEAISKIEQLETRIQTLENN